MAIIEGKTASGLCEYCVKMIGRPYWNGTYGQIATEALYLAKKKQLPKMYTAKDFPSQYGQRVHDCSGLPKGYHCSDTPESVPKNAQKMGCDYNAGMLYNASTVKGRIDTFPAYNGLLVYNSTKGHVGVYYNGNIIEAKGHAYGVIVSEFTKTRWYFWSEDPFIYYDTKDNPKPEPTPTPKPEDTKMRTLRQGSKGDAVKVWQQILACNGIKITIDGDFGAKTREHTITFQKQAFPTEPKEWDGIAGDKTWGAGLRSIN